MNSPAGPLRGTQCTAAVLVAAGFLSLAGAGGSIQAQQAGTTAAARLIPNRARVAAASPELRTRLEGSPLALFRFVNQAWTREVCDAFAGDLAALPTARLHGDAHIEQYALTASARGLDDFDDSARGPAVVDIVRFLGSLELTARDRGWMEALPPVIDAFFEGYQTALEDPAYRPPDPAVVTRLRAASVRSPQEFLAWAESLMEPLDAAERARLDESWKRFEVYAVTTDVEFSPAFLTPKKVGWLRLGIGSALVPKLLLRVEGPSSAPDDDVVMEAKEVTPLGGVPCLIVPPSGDAFRVVEGVHQIGRIPHRLLVTIPVVLGTPRDARGWWVKTWDPSYRELEIADLASAGELRDVARDVGAQLGGTNLAESSASLAAQKRLMELEGVRRLGPRIRQVTHDLTTALVEAWQQFRTAR